LADAGGEYLLKKHRLEVSKETATEVDGKSRAVDHSTAAGERIHQWRPAAKL